jgi:hypothetical protein
MQTNRNITRVIIALISWVLILQTAPLAIAEEIDGESKHFKSLPAGTFGIAHLRNVPKTVSELQGSVLYRTLRSILDSQAYREARESNKHIGIMEELISGLLRDIPKALTGEFTLAFTGYNLEANEPELIVLADADEKQFATLIEKVLAPAIAKLGGPELIIDRSAQLTRIGPAEMAEGLLYKTGDGQMVLSPFKHSFDSIKNITESMADNPLFKATFEKHFKPSDTVVFVNLREILKFVIGASDEAVPEPIRMTGIADIAAVGASSKTTEKGGLGELTLYSPDGLKGALNLFSHRGWGPTIERYIPDDYSFFVKVSVGSFDGFYKDLVSLLEEARQEDWIIDEFNDAIEEIGDELGFSIEDDLLPNIGGEIAFAAKAPKVIGIPEMAVFLEVKDKAKLQRLIDGFVDRLMPFLNFTTAEYKGVRINTTTVNIVQPSYAFIDNYLVVADAPAVIQDIINTLATGRSILTKDDYRSVFADLPSKGFLSMYLDTKEVLNPLVPLITSRAHRAPAFVPSALVTLQMNLQETAGIGLVLSADDDSLQIKGFCGIGSIETMLPIVAGLLLPVTFHAKSEAIRVSSMSNLKELCLYQVMYAADHDGEFAENLSDLYPEYVSYFQVFQHPSSETDRLTKKEDIDRLADYELVKGIKEGSPPAYILAYEKDQFSEGGRNVGFLDGRVEWMSEQEFQRKLKAQIEQMRGE